MKTTQKKWSIYCLVDTRNQEVFYIGRTSKKPLKRLEEHLEQLKGNTPKQLKIREINDSNWGGVDIVVLEKNITSEKRAFSREVYWIEIFLSSGAGLTNAAIDFKGTYFLVDPEQNKKDEIEDGYGDGFFQSSKDEIASDDQSIGVDFDYYRFEASETITYIHPKGTNYNLNVSRKRLENKAAKHPLNHGLPFTVEELQLVKRFHEEGWEMSKITNYFQRGEGSIKNMLAYKLK